MNTTVKGGLYIGLFCAAWTYIMGFTGWYKDPTMLNLFYMVIPIEIGVLFWGMRTTASINTFGGQFVAGTLMSTIGGAILIISSLLFTTVVFPEYFEELRAMGAEAMRQEGKSEAQITAALDAIAPTQNSLMQAIMGFVGTVVTGFIASFILAFIFRKKKNKNDSVSMA